jgi:hypothetical protein
MAEREEEQQVIEADLGFHTAWAAHFPLDLPVVDDSTAIEAAPTTALAPQASAELQTPPTSELELAHDDLEAIRERIEHTVHTVLDGSVARDSIMRQPVHDMRMAVGRIMQHEAQYEHLWVEGIQSALEDGIIHPLNPDFIEQEKLARVVDIIKERIEKEHHDAELVREADVNAMHESMRNAMFAEPLVLQRVSGDLQTLIENEMVVAAVNTVVATAHQRLTHGFTSLNPYTVDEQVNTRIQDRLEHVASGTSRRPAAELEQVQKLMREHIFPSRDKHVYESDPIAEQLVHEPAFQAFRWVEATLGLDFTKEFTTEGNTPLPYFSEEQVSMLDQTAEPHTQLIQNVTVVYTQPVFEAALDLAREFFRRQEIKMVGEESAAAYQAEVDQGEAIPLTSERTTLDGLTRSAQLAVLELIAHMQDGYEEKVDYLLHNPNAPHVLLSLSGTLGSPLTAAWGEAIWEANAINAAAGAYAEVASYMSATAPEKLEPVYEDSETGSAKVIMSVVVLPVMLGILLSACAPAATSPAKPSATPVGPTMLPPSPNHGILASPSPTITAMFTPTPTHEAVFPTPPSHGYPMNKEGFSQNAGGALTRDMLTGFVSKEDVNAVEQLYIKVGNLNGLKPPDEKGEGGDYGFEYYFGNKTWTILMRDSRTQQILLLRDKASHSLYEGLMPGDPTVPADNFDLVPVNYPPGHSGADIYQKIIDDASGYRVVGAYDKSGKLIAWLYLGPDITRLLNMNTITMQVQPGDDGWIDAFGTIMATKEPTLVASPTSVKPAVTLPPKPVVTKDAATVATPVLKPTDQPTPQPQPSAAPGATCDVAPGRTEARSSRPAGAMMLDTLGSGSLTVKFTSVSNNSSVVTADTGVKDDGNNPVVVNIDLNGLTIQFLGNGSTVPWKWKPGCDTTQTFATNDGITMVFNLPPDKKAQFLQSGSPDQEGFKSWLIGVLKTGQFGSVIQPQIKYGNTAQ